MARAVLWFLLLVFVLRALSRLVHGIARGMQGSDEPARRQTNAVALAKDPVCGTYVVPSRALTSGSGDDIQYFCSERCRRQWATR